MINEDELLSPLFVTNILVLDSSQDFFLFPDVIHYYTTFSPDLNACFRMILHYFVKNLLR